MLKKNVVIISSSPRKDGNSETLAKSFARGAVAAGHSVRFVYVLDYHLGYCHACYRCSKTGECFQHDGMNDIAKELLAADVLVFATPVYFYSMSGQLKVLIDRLVPWYTKIRADIYMLCTAWDSDTKMLQATFDAIRGCTRDCFENCEEKGALAVGGVGEKGEIEGRPELKDAYLMGFEC